MSEQDQSETKAGEFERLSRAASRGAIAEIIYFLKHNKKWWLLPIVLMLLLISALVILGAAAPFIYTLF